MSMHNPAHPGEILRELVIEPLGLSVTQAARHLGISRKTLSKLLNGRGVVTPEMALRLEMTFSKPDSIALIFALRLLKPVLFNVYIWPN